MNVVSSISYLHHQQKADGSFLAVSSPKSNPFVATREQETIFPTILIAHCLKELEQCSAIYERACEYIAKQQLAQGSWNYWVAASASKTQEPYPDDLDDTALAFALLALQNPNWSDGQRAGQFTRLLVASEEQAGGPYNTWLIDTQKHPRWKDVDIAVNANIALALSTQKVDLAGLRVYFLQALETGEYISSYYVGESPVLYFLSRTSLVKEPLFAKTLTQSIPKVMRSNALQCALLLTASCNALAAGHNAKLRVYADQLAADLESLRQDDHWPAEALYVDPVYGGQQYYGGSEVLTTALAIEALHRHKQIEQRQAVQKTLPGQTFTQQAMMLHIRQSTQGIATQAMRSEYITAGRRIIFDKSSNEILSAASLIASAVYWEVPETRVQALNKGSVHGWIAYTLIDDMLDGDSTVSKLPLAMFAARQSQSYFSEDQHSRETNAMVEQVFNVMDSANDWEQRFARVKVAGQKVLINELPNYGSYKQLADRSWGHSLAATLIFLQNYDPNSREVSALKSFYRHFLIARQLNDDAHDWEDDLMHGQISAVVTLLLANVSLPTTLHIKNDIDELRNHFWSETIDTVAVLIQRHCKQARRHLKSLEAVMNTEVFEQWLTALEQSTERALQGKHQAGAFIQALNGR